MRLPIIFLSRMDRHGQIVFARWDRAIVTRRIGAIGVIRLVEIQYQLAAMNITYLAVDITACSITAGAAGCIRKGTKR
jgi:hypothetical protein